MQKKDGYMVLDLLSTAKLQVRMPPGPPTVHWSPKLARLALGVFMALPKSLLETSSGGQLKPSSRSVYRGHGVAMEMKQSWNSPRFRHIKEPSR